MLRAALCHCRWRCSSRYRVPGGTGGGGCVGGGDGADLDLVLLNCFVLARVRVR